MTVPALPSVVPLPASMEAGEGSFVLTAHTPIVASAELSNEATWWASELTTSSGEAPAVLPATSDPTGAITLSIDDTLGDEAYVLDIDDHGVRITGGSGAGVFWGLVTLRQLLPPSSFTSIRTDDAFAIDGLHVEDAPRFAHRGLLFDEARWFFGADVARRVIDWMVLHKLNVLHWHLTDDQGWRIEIRGWPLLTEIGAWRAGSQMGDWFGETDRVDWTPHGGFYTQDDIRAIVDYAARRHVTIVPEIDVPGHSVAALAAYPSLACTDGSFQVSQYFRTHDDILCVCEEETFTFLFSVLDEVMELFPSEIIHVGGDEVPTIRWEESTACAARMTELGFTSASQLHGWTIDRLAGYLEAHGRRAQGWNEVLHDGLPASVLIQHWRSETDDVTMAITTGHEVVQSPYEPTYLNRDYTTVSVADAYALAPVPDGVDARGIRGIEACMWTPWHSNLPELEFQIFPRIAAIAEVAWTPASELDYSDFTRRVETMLARYDALGIGWGSAERTPP